MKLWNILIIGLGSIGQRHVRILRETVRSNIFALRQKTTRPLNLPGITEYFFRWADVPMPSIDFAIICNPTPLHIPTASILVRNDIPFLMEKPVCSSLDGAVPLLRLVQKKRLPVLIGFNWRYHHLYQKIKRIASSLELGKPLSFLTEMGQHLPDWRSYDYTASSSARKKLGGGVIFDLTHEIDLAVDLMEDVRLLSCIKRKVSDLKIDTEDIAEITLLHNNGGLSQIHLDYLQKAYSHKIKLIFEGGELFWDYSLGILKMTTKGRTRVYIQPQDYSRDDMFRAQLRHWLRVIRKKEKPVVSLEHGLYVSQLAIAAHASSDRRKWITIS